MKKIENYPGYFAMEEGYIYSEKSNKILSSFIDNLGYEQVILYKNGKRCYVRVHRLIAETFIPNPEEYKQVNHIDGIKHHNNIENLEWCNNSQNTKHGYDNNLYLSTKNLKIKAINKYSEEIQIFDSLRKCALALNINRKTLSAIIKEEKQNNNYDYVFEIIDN